jgi:hypothetical protein
LPMTENLASEEASYNPVGSEILRAATLTKGTILVSSEECPANRFA